MRALAHSLQWLALSLIIVLSGVLYIGTTGAYFSDEEYGTGSFNSALVDIELSTDEAFPSSPVLPGGEAEAKILLSNNSLPVSYRLSLTSVSNPTLCQALPVELSYQYYDESNSLTNIPLYTGNLGGLLSLNPDPDPKAIPNLLTYQPNPDYGLHQHWFKLSTSVPADLDPLLQGLNCQVSLVAEAWQAGQLELVGFTDSDSLSLALDVGVLDTCEPGTAFFEAVEASQGKRKNGTSVLSARSNPDIVKGGADGVFFSLGFGGSLIGEFAAPIENGPGADLILAEITNGRASYPEELAQVEVSQNGSDWVALGLASSKHSGGISSFDLASIGMPWIRFVKITDLSVAANFPNDGDGYDLDSVYGVYGTCQSQFPSCSQITGRVVSDIDQSGLRELQVGLVRPDAPVEVLSVSSQNPNPIASSILGSDRYYVVEVSGTWTNQNGAREVDAAYFSDNNWNTKFQMKDLPGRDDRQLTLTLNNQFVEWGEYNSSHRYKTVVKGQGSSLLLRIFDEDQDPNKPSWYNDNRDSLTVKIIDITDSLATSDTEGKYAFDACLPGIYQVVSIPDASWQLVAPLNYHHFTQDSIPPSADVKLTSIIVLNEVLANPVGDDWQFKPNGEWVELYSLVSESVDVSGWSINSNSGTMPLSDISWDTDLNPYDIDDLVISSLGFGTVYNTTGVEQLANPGDTLRLVDNLGRLRDRFVYSGTKAEGDSWVRLPDGTGDWVDPLPTLGQSNQSSQTPFGKYQFNDDALLVGLFGLGNYSQYQLSVLFGYGPDATLSGQLDVGGLIDKPYLYRDDFDFETCSDDVCVPFENVVVTGVQLNLVDLLPINLEPYDD